MPKAKREPRPLVTLFTDASFDSALRLGTWAAWVKFNGKTWRYSGPLKAEVENSGEAELAAIANGIYIINRLRERREILAEGELVILAQTDSLEAISAIKKISHPRQQARDIIDDIWSRCTAANFVLYLRHVKGHKGAATPRNAVNSWCDKECRRHMAQLIADAQTSKTERTAQCPNTNLVTAGATQTS